jgi:GNAT superfamily N-acetyltransferase
MQSRQRRFFLPKKGFSERELAFFLEIDFETHVALVAQIDEDGHPIIAGGGCYIVVQPGHAEIAFVVVDDYQGQGIGTILMRHLAVLARDAGLKELIAEVLPENSCDVEAVQEVRLQACLERLSPSDPSRVAAALNQAPRFMVHPVGTPYRNPRSERRYPPARASSWHTKLPVKPRPYHRCRFVQ